MKKTLIALSVLAGSGAAMAQSSVTLYGLVDANYGERKVTTTTSASTTVAKSTGLMDGGTNGLNGSRWGLRGTEDLGGGIKANFTLEQRFNVNDGTLNGVLFNGRSIVGLSGAFGSVDLGREYTPRYFLFVASDADGFSSRYSTTRGGPDRRDSSINYTSPNFSGFTVKAQVGHNTTQTTLNGAITNNNALNTAFGTTLPASAVPLETKDKGLGLSAVYGNGPLMVGLAYDNQKGLSTAPETKAWVLGGTYDFSVAKLFANVHQSKITQTGQPENKDREFNLGVTVPMGAVSLMAGVGRNTSERAGGAGFSRTGTDYMLGADYNLSKRTKAYFRAGTRDKLSGTNFSTKSEGYSIGLRHTF